MTPLKLLIAINVRWWNAEAAYAFNVAKSFHDMGHSVLLLATSSTPVHQKALKAGLTVIDSISLDSRSPWQLLRSYRQLCRLVEEHRIDVINSYKSEGAVLFSLLRWKFPQITYCKTRGEARQPRQNWANRLLYGPKGCDGVISVGEKVSRWIKELIPQSQPSTIIYYGCDPLSPNRGAQDIIDQKLGLKTGDRLLVLVGRTQAVKGHLLFLQAFQEITDQRYHLLFLIKDPDEYPDELSAIQAFIQEKKLETRVHWRGFQENLADWVARADLGVIPSLDSEVNCRVAVEFFSLGVPVLAFPTGTLPDIVRSHENGYLCQEPSTQEILRGVAEVFQSDEYYKALSDGAAQTYQNEFTISRFYQDTLRFYQGVRKQNLD